MVVARKDVAVVEDLIPQQRKLMGSSAQISSGVCRCGSQEQVPEEGSGRFERVLWCAARSNGVSTNTTTRTM